MKIKKLYYLLALFIIGAISPDNCLCELQFSLNQSSFAWEIVKNDYSEFYSINRLIRMGIFTGGAGILANTSMDETLRDQQAYTRDQNSNDDGISTQKSFGEGIYLIPFCLAASMSDQLFNLTPAFTKSPIAKWGERTARSYLVGGPLVLTMQRLIGSSRPGENEKSSKWQPFKDSNGVSGHAFIGAVPFMHLARMNKRNKFFKYFFYLASTATAIFRVKDDQHYISQAFLGWYYAWEAADAIDDLEKKESAFNIKPLVGFESYGIKFSYRW